MIKNVKFADCKNCPFKNHKPVGSAINPNAEILVVNDYPSKEDVYSGQQQAGDTGRLIRTSVGSGEASYATLIACSPNDSPIDLERAIVACSARIGHIVKSMSPKTIVTTGALATKTVLGHLGVIPDSDAIAKLRGKEWITPDTLLNQSKRVVATYKASHVAINPKLKGDLDNDIAFALGTFTPEKILDTMPEVKVISSLDDLKEVDLPVGSELTYDIETDNLRWVNQEDNPGFDILCVGFASTERILVFEWKEELKEAIKSIIYNNVLIGHNAKFDDLFLRREGITPTCSWDTMLVQHIIDPTSRLSLKELGQTLFGMPDWEEDLDKYLARTQENKRYSKIPKPILHKYLGYDVWVTMKLYLLQKTRLPAEQKKLVEFVMKENEVIEQMEANGIQVDASYLDDVGYLLEGVATKLEEELRQMCGKPKINLNSSKQIAEILYDELKLPPPQGYKYKGKERSTDAAALEQFKGMPFVDKLLDLRAARKLSTSYVENIFDRLSETGRAHTDYKLHGALTGRLSTQKPALQTIPREGKNPWGAYIKASFCAQEGNKLIVADYSQAELRVAAALSGDEFLLSFFNRERKEGEKADLHAEVAERIWGSNYTKENRSVAKIVNFAWLYGANASVIAAQAKISFIEADKIVTDYEQLLGTLKAWRDSTFNKARICGYVSTPMGRRQYFPIINKQNYREVWKSCSNTPIQGGAAEATIQSLIRLYSKGFGKYLVLTVHDSILLEVPKDSAESIGLEVQKTMKEVAQEMFPSVKWNADIDIEDRWAKIPTKK